jgi:hypothetical protein
MNKLQVLENFMSTLKLQGVCGFHIMEDDLGFQIILVLDKEYVNETKPGFIAERLRIFVFNQIKNYLGVEDVYIGSTVGNCDKIISR